jgi:hypothetical protein
VAANNYQQHKAAGTLDEVSPPPRTTCEQCGQPIPKGRRWGAKYCSTTCKQAALDAEKHAALLTARATRNRTCGWCKEPLSVDKRFGTRFCSQKCSDDWNNHQKALSAKRAKKAAREPCAVCEGPIPESRNAHAIYCSPDCKGRSQQASSPKKRKTRQDYNRRYLYDMTQERFDAMLAAQDGKCAICRSPDWPASVWPGIPQVDHDHVTGAIRGLLCGDCNTGLGKFGDDPMRLAAAIVYLTRDDPDQLRAAVAYLEANAAASALAHPLTVRPS